jgi:hypothetical protein
MPLITTATARQMAARCAESRRLNPLKAVPPGFKLVPADYLEHVPASDEYPAVVLARTRTQLDLVAKRITEELEKDKPDSRRLRDLSVAQYKLSEQERILAGRPLPGSRRLQPERTPAHAAYVPLCPVPIGERTAISEPEPEPQPPGQPG